MGFAIAGAYAYAYGGCLPTEPAPCRVRVKYSQHQISTPFGSASVNRMQMSVKCRRRGGGLFNKMRGCFQSSMRFVRGGVFSVTQKIGLKF